MKLIFIDESGSSLKLLDHSQQPYYVLAAICFDSNNYKYISENIKKVFKDIFPESKKTLGFNHEIKAKDVFNDKSKFTTNDNKKQILEKMLNSPEIAWACAVDKRKHKTQYTNPEYPFKLSLQYIFERIQFYLLNTNEHCICIFDQTKKYDDKMHEETVNMIERGSTFSKGLLEFYQFKANRVLECCLGNSKNSIGLQIADFYATGTYQYYKASKSETFWWTLIEDKLYKEKGKILGYGLKEIPTINK